VTLHLDDALMFRPALDGVHGLDAAVRDRLAERFPAVQEEIARLRRLWAPQLGARDPASAVGVLEEVLGQSASELDLFDRVQLAEVLRVCRECRSLSEAGRRLFDRSRERKRSSNDADRLRKYLGRFGLDFERVRAPIG